MDFGDNTVDVGNTLPKLGDGGMCAGNSYMCIYCEFSLGVLG